MSATSSSWRARARTTGRLFHRVIRLGIIQGGDPLSKDPAKAKLYGTGGLGVLKAEIQCGTRDAGRRRRGAAAEQSGQRRRAVLRLRDRSAGARRQVHGLRPGVRRHGRRAEDFRGAVRRRGTPDRADRDRLGRRFATRRRPSRSRSRPRRDASWRGIGPCSRRPPGPITIEFFPDKAPEHVRELPAARAVRASSTAPRSTASSAASSCRPGGSTPAGR